MRLKLSMSSILENIFSDDILVASIQKYICDKLNLFFFHTTIYYNITSESNFELILGEIGKFLEIFSYHLIFGNKK